MHISPRLLESDTGTWCKWLSSECCSNSTRISKKDESWDIQKSQSLGTWLLMGELAYMGHYLCGLDERTSTSIGGSRNTLDPRKPKP